MINLFSKEKVMTKLKKILKNAFTGLILKKPAKKVFNKMSGRDKIKKIAEQQKEQKTLEINSNKQQACAAITQHYQQYLAEIAENKRQMIEMQNILSADKEELVNYINQVKTGLLHNDRQGIQDDCNQIVALLDHQAAEIVEQYIAVVRDLETEIISFSQQQEEVVAQQSLTEAEISTISQQLPTQLDVLADQLAEKYESMLNDAANNLEELNNQEATVAAEYSKELANINKQYNDALENVVQQIDAWKKQASKKATKNFVIQTAAGIVANCVAPGISASFGVASKVGMAAIKSATFSTINSIATGQLKTLPKSMLRNVSTSIVNPLVSTNIVDPLGISNAAVSAGISGSISGGIIAKCSHGTVLSSMVQGGVEAYVGRALEELGNNEKPAVVSQVESADTNLVATNKVLPSENSGGAITTRATQNAQDIVVPQEAPLGLFEFDKEPLPTPSREDLFPTKPPRASFNKSLPKESRDPSFKIMERNNSFQPVLAHQGSILDCVEKSVRDQSAIYSTIESQQQYAVDVVRKQYGENASVGITPFFAVKSSSSAARPGFLKAATETQFTAGVNVAQINNSRFKLGIDIGRTDVLVSTEMAAKTSARLKVEPHMSSSFSLKASAIAATAEIGPVKIPFSGVACTSSVQAGFLTYDSTSVVPASFTRVTVSTTCAQVFPEVQSVNLRASLRP